MKWINVNDKLPEDNSYVIIHLIDMPWLDRDDKYGKRFYKIARFHKGKTAEELEKLKCPISANDVWGINKVPYGWSQPPSHYWGQEVDFWMEIPLIKEIK